MPKNSCPFCGSKIDLSKNQCPSCGQPYYILGQENDIKKIAEGSDKTDKKRSVNKHLPGIYFFFFVLFVMISLWIILLALVLKSNVSKNESKNGIRQECVNNSPVSDGVWKLRWIDLESFVLVSRYDLEVYDRKSFELVRLIRTHYISDVSFWKYDSSVAAIISDFIGVFDLKTGELIFSTEDDEYHTGPIIRFFPESSILIYIRDDVDYDRLYGLNFKTREAINFNYFTNSKITDMDVSPKEQFLTIAFEDGSVKVFGIDGENNLKPAPLISHVGRVNKVIFLSDSFLLSGGSDGKVKFWRIPEGGLTKTIDIGRSVFDIRVSSDSKFLGILGSGGQLTIWEINLADSLMVRKIYTTEGVNVFDFSGTNLEILLVRSSFFSGDKFCVVTLK